MNAASRGRLNRRLESLEAKAFFAPLPTVEIRVVEPGPDGPIDTGERWAATPAGFVQTRPADDAR